MKRFRKCFEWNYINNPITQNYSLSERKGYLRLYGSEKSLSENPGVTFVGRRQQHFNFNASTTLDFNPITENEEAGITLYKDALHHYQLFIRKIGKERELVLAYNIGKINAIEKRMPLKRKLISSFTTCGKIIQGKWFDVKGSLVVSQNL